MLIQTVLVLVIQSPQNDAQIGMPSPHKYTARHNPCCVSKPDLIRVTCTLQVAGPEDGEWGAQKLFFSVLLKTRAWENLGESCSLDLLSSEL